MSGLSLISGSMSFARSIGVDVPFADRLLAGNLCGGTVRDTKRSVLRTLMPSSFKGAPVVADAHLQCSLGAGLRMPVTLPDDYTVVCLVRNHKRPAGNLLPVLADFGPGTTGPQLVNGSGLGLQAAGGNLAAVSFYQSGTTTAQGAYVSIAGQDGGSPSFLAATMSGTTSRAHAGVSGELQTAEVTVSSRNPENWRGKPLYAGADARVAGDSQVDAAYQPFVFMPLVYTPLSTAEVRDLYRWMYELAPLISGLPAN